MRWLWPYMFVGLMLCLAVGVAWYLARLAEVMFQ